MQFWIDSDEVYPVFSLKKAESALSYDEVVEVPDELVERYNKVCKEYAKIQRELRKLAKYDEEL